jgi:uncharacterized protein YbbC (DUF1343 family)
MSPAAHHPPRVSSLAAWLTARGDRAFPRARWGVIAHAASVQPGGAHTVEVLHARWGARLAAVFAPEHGFAGRAAAGAAVRSARASPWGCPVHSLYGAARRPTPEMLRGLDALLFDVQDLGVRCYTYGSTLRGVLEAAAEAGLPVVVADRPVPWYGAADGPILDPAFESFVGMLPGVPLVHGLTPAELARWLCAALRLELDLHWAPLPDGNGLGPPPSPWTPPSPAIRSFACARGYPATVWIEALPALDADRAGALAFQRLGARWLRPRAVIEALGPIPGVRVRPDAWVSAGASMRGVRLEPMEGAAWRPVEMGARLLRAIAAVHGEGRLWRARGAARARPVFFDQLAGTNAWRTAVRGGEEDFRAACARARRAATAFLRRAEGIRLYGTSTGS